MANMTGLKAIIGWSSFAVACFALLGYAFLIEPNWLDLNIHDVSIRNPSDRIRIVQLSDLHLQTVGKREMAIAEALQKIKPDLIILTGDVIDRPDALPTLDQFLKTLVAAPKVAVCQSAPNTFHLSASNTFHFFSPLRLAFALLEAVRVVPRFQDIAVMRDAIQ